MTLPTEAAATPLRAERVDIGQPGLDNAVRFRGKIYSAGLASYRIGRALTVPAFSLSLGENAVGTTLYDTLPAGNGIARMPALRALSESWERMSATDRSKPVYAAAYQVAIWNRSADLPVNRKTVPSPELRREAKQLLRELPHVLKVDYGRNTNLWRKKCLEEACGEDPASPELLARVGDSTVEDQIVNIELQLGDLEKSLDVFQAIDVRLGEAYALVCTGTAVHIDTDLGAVEKSRIPPCAPGSGRSKTFHYPIQLIADRRCLKGEFKGIRYGFNGHFKKKQITCVSLRPRPKKGCERKKKRVGDSCNVARVNKIATDYATINFPRDEHIKYVYLAWNMHLEAGDVYEPVDGGVSIITAGGGTLPITRTVRLNPSDLAGLEKFLETTVVAKITGWGGWGLVVLGVALLALLTLPRLLGFFGVKFWDWGDRRRHVLTQENDRPKDEPPAPSDSSEAPPDPKELGAPEGPAESGLSESSPEAGEDDQSQDPGPERGHRGRGE